MKHIARAAGYFLAVFIVGEGLPVLLPAQGIEQTIWR
jgi:hypothetical protein